ncbi:SusC/RagA family TonB-linked outer membrane protein [Mucilaginibacter sp.]|uniref:SusC/RagA family TonB-linked outer membrane protein n=1 Tax=Mucilaginibacter sp. TaxID=1882438 RepID=UPI00261E7D6F|nr:SusC/RagA family TonB-linked outer membrane protein [Mucilaginibacter sp.]
MKLTVIILIISLMEVSASGLAQKITMSRNKVSIAEVFSEIKKQTEYRVIWPSNLFDANKRIMVSFKDTPLDEVMDKVLENNAFTYELVNKTVVLKQKEPSVLNKILNVIENVDVSGRIVDAKGRGLAWVTVRVIDGSGYTTTNDQGQFLLSQISGNAVIAISSVGYSPITIQIINRTCVVKPPIIQNGKNRKSDTTTVGEKSELLNGKLNNVMIRLATATSRLEEVVVNKGYYTTTQRLNTGNVVKITAEEIEKQPVANFLQALQGRVPGLIITQQSGVPGSNFTVQIRGQNSILNGNDPLYIVDGIPYSPSNLNQVLSGYTGTGSSTASGSAAGLGGLSPLNNINPADLESIEILKDADATAIYGSRGANGVILITTKKGGVGPLLVSANVNYGTNLPTRLAKFMNTQQYLEMRNEAFKNDNAKPGPSDYDVTTWDKNKYTDWTKALIGSTSSTVNTQLSVSGGTIQTRYQLGFDYSKQNPPYGGNFSDDRGALRFNINNTSKNGRFTMGFGATYSVDNNNLPGMDVYGNVGLAPNAPDMLNPDGSLLWTDYVNNPYASLLRPYNASTKNLMANGQLGYKVIQGLNIKAAFGYTNTYFSETRNNPASSMLPTSYNITQANSSFGTRNGSTWIFEPQAEFERNMLKGNVKILIGSTLQGNESDGQIITGIFKSDAFLNIISAATTKTITNSYSQYKYAAIFGRFSYNYQDKYLFNLTGRRDGSSRFGPDHQFANFGAIGLGWIFSEENLIKDNLPFLSLGKIRSSYGITGNDQVQNYQYLDSYTPSSTYTYQGLNGLKPSRLYNPDFEWEANKKLEAAIELGFLKDRITLSTSWFRNRSSNQLVNVPLSPATGSTFVTANLPATVQNTGWEIMVTSVNIRSGNFTWKTSGNVTFARNKLIAFPDLEKSSYKNTYIVGEPVTILKLYNYAGVNPTTGLYQFINKAGVLTSNPIYGTDNTTVFSASPKYYGGLQNSFTYKGVSLDIFMQFVKQDGKNLLTGWSNLIGSANNLPLAFLDRWQKPGDIAPIQRYTQTYGAASTAGTAAANSNQGWTDASYLRCKNVAVSYVINPRFLQKMAIKSAKIYCQAQNLFTITNYMGADPETQGLVLPPMKTISGGIQLTL